MAKKRNSELIKWRNFMERVCVGEILKPQGIKGEVKIKLYDKGFQLLDLKNFVIDNEMYIVEESRKNGEFLYIKFKGVCTVNDAENLRGKVVCLTEQNAKDRLKENEYYIEQLLGFSVLVENKIIGKLEDVQNFGSADVYYLTAENGKEIMFPLVSGIIEDINTEHKHIQLNKQKFDEVAVFED